MQTLIPRAGERAGMLDERGEQVFPVAQTGQFAVQARAQIVVFLGASSALDISTI